MEGLEPESPTSASAANAEPLNEAATATWKRLMGGVIERFFMLISHQIIDPNGRLSFLLSR